MGGTEAEPIFVTAADIARNFGRWQDEASRAPVIVTHHGRRRVVILAADAFEQLAATPSKDPCEARLAALLNHSAEAFFAVNAAMTVTVANQMLLDFIGSTVGQVVGRPYGEVFPAAARSLPGEHVRRVLRTGEPCQFEMLSTVRRGAVLDVRAFPYADGVGVLCLNRTEERMVARQLRGAGSLEQALLVADHASVVELNIRGGIVAASRAFEEMTGFGPSELVRHRLADLLVPRTRSGLISALEAVFAGDGPGSAKAVVLGRDGRETPVMLGLAAMDDLEHQRAVRVVVLPA